jgi:uncharacterized protein
MSDAKYEPLQAVLAGYPEIRLAILFGSVATGTAGPESDVDIAVLTNGPLGVELRMNLITGLARITGRPIDLVDLSVVGEPLLAQIVKHGIRLAGTDETHARLIARHLFDEADFMPLHRRVLAERRRAWIGR